MAVTSKPLNPVRQYLDIRATILVFVSLGVVVGAWAVNGWATVLFVQAVAPALLLSHAITIHLLATLFELGGPNVRTKLHGIPFAGVIIGMLYFATLVAGVVDVFSSALFFLALIGRLGIDLPMIGVVDLDDVVAAVVGGAVALLPEPAIVGLVVAAWRIVRPLFKR